MQLTASLSRIALFLGAAFPYRPCAGVPAFVAHELVVGPLCAGVFPNPDFDTSLRTERLFYFAG